MEAASVKRPALIVVLFLMKMGFSYFVEDPVGSDPSKVYRIIVPGRGFSIFTVYESTNSTALVGSTA